MLLNRKLHRRSAGSESDISDYNVCSMKHSPRSNCEREIVKYCESTTPKHAQKFVVSYAYPSGHRRVISGGSNDVFIAKSEIVLKRVYFRDSH